MITEEDDSGGVRLNEARRLGAGYRDLAVHGPRVRGASLTSRGPGFAGEATLIMGSAS